VSRVEARNLWKIYPGNVVGVKNLSFVCEDKEFLAVLGPSGSGKSSTLRMLAGLEEISKGELLFDGRVVNHLSPAERNVALAFESYALYYRLSVYENIAFPLRARGLKGPEVDKRVKEIAELMELTPHLKKRPGSLPGGLQQRVSLARALVRKPNVTLLDEPISHMDQQVRHEIRARIRHLHDELGLTTIYVTHDQAEAIALCDRMLIIHQGELQQIGTVEEIWNYPANKFVAYFVGEPAMNFIPALVKGTNQIVIPGETEEFLFTFEGEVDPKYVDSQVELGIRPQQIEVSRKRKVANSVSGTVKILEFQGDKVVLTVSLDDQPRSEVKAVVAAQERYQEGERVWLYFPPPVIHIFVEDLPIIRREKP